MSRIIILIGILFCNLYNVSLAQDAIISGQVVMPGAMRASDCAVEGQGCCDLDFYDMGGVELTIRNSSNAVVATPITNSTGHFSEELPLDLYSITPRFADDENANWSEGVSTLDIVFIRKHFLRIEPIGCPFNRIAGDVSNDGRLDTIDMELIRDLVLRYSFRFNRVPNWQFIAEAYVTAHEDHSDFKFLGDFWNLDYENNCDIELPFAGIYQDPMGANYVYGSINRGKSAQKLWRNFLCRQELAEYNPCKETYWGFYGFKSGDVNGSAVPNNAKSGPNELTSLTYNYELVDIDGTVINTLPVLDANKQYRITVSANLQPNVYGYQLGLSLDRNMLNVSNLTTNEDIAGVLDSNYVMTDLSLRTAWVSTDMEEGEPMQERTELFSLEVAPQTTVLSLPSVFAFSNQVLNNAFYASEEVIDRGIIYVSVQEIE